LSFPATTDNIDRVKTLLRTVLLGFLALMTTSCLTTRVDLDLRSDDRLILSLTYEMPISLWQFGVFDEESPERSIPVSRRDAEETATLYEDVTLETYELVEKDDVAVIHVVYHAGTVESLQGLWGRVAGAELELSFETGTLTLPLNEGVPEGGVDPQQRDLITEVFEGEEFSVTVRTPGEVRPIAFPEIPGFTSDEPKSDEFQWSAPMAAILLAESPNVIELTW
jgi:hypothetical protein